MGNGVSVTSLDPDNKELQRILTEIGVISADYPQSRLRDLTLAKLQSQADELVKRIMESIHIRIGLFAEDARETNPERIQLINANINKLIHQGTLLPRFVNYLNDLRLLLTKRLNSKFMNVFRTGNPTKAINQFEITLPPVPELRARRKRRQRR